MLALTRTTCRESNTFFVVRYSQLGCALLCSNLAVRFPPLLQPVLSFKLVLSQPFRYLLIPSATYFQPSSSDRLPRLVAFNGLLISSVLLAWPVVTVQRSAIFQLALSFEVQFTSVFQGQESFVLLCTSSSSNHHNPCPTASLYQDFSVSGIESLSTANRPPCQLFPVALSASSRSSVHVHPNLNAKSLPADYQQPYSLYSFGPQRISQSLVQALPSHMRGPPPHMARPLIQPALVMCAVLCAAVLLCDSPGFSACH